MKYEYKTVGAPEKGKRRRGARTASDRVAVAFEEILDSEAVDGWEYLRTDLLPVHERAGLFSRVQEMHRAVMVFRRALEEESTLPLVSPAAAPSTAPAVTPPTPIRPVRDSAREAPPLRTAPASKPAPESEPEQKRREPVIKQDRDPDLQIADFVRGTDRKPE